MNAKTPSNKEIEVITKESKTNNKIINCLYSNFKNTSKKLKIVCDWDEVIQAHEPYAEYLANLEQTEKNRPFGIKYRQMDFSTFFNAFWSLDKIEYSPYGSKLKELPNTYKERISKQNEIKNSPDFYQQAPFLTIAEDLLKLIKEGKIERLIFLSAYDKRKFPYGDERKEKIFEETFYKVGYPHEKKKDCTVLPCYLELIPFDSELLERADFHQTLDNETKGQWIRKNFPDADIVIDDNPKICKEMLDTTQVCKECYGIMVGDNAPSELPECKSGKCIKIKATILAPYYPAIENQHDERVSLIKNEVSNLKKEDFKDENN